MIQAVYNIEVEDAHTYFVSEGQIWVHNTSSTKGPKSFETYTKTKDNGQVYSGRTSGSESPAQNVANRDKYHHKNEEGFGPAELDKTSTASAPIRGREQQLIDKNGGAKSMKGSSGNEINGISPKNQKASEYLNAADKEFGK